MWITDDAPLSQTLWSLPTRFVSASPSSSLVLLGFNQDLWSTYDLFHHHDCGHRRRCSDARGTRGGLLVAVDVLEVGMTTLASGTGHFLVKFLDKHYLSDICNVGPFHPTTCQFSSLVTRHMTLCIEWWHWRWVEFSGLLLWNGHQKALPRWSTTMRIFFIAPHQWST